MRLTHAVLCVAMGCSLAENAELENPPKRNLRSTSAVPMRAGTLLKVDANRSFIWVWLFWILSVVWSPRTCKSKILRRAFFFLFFFCFLKAATDSESYWQTVCPDWVEVFRILLCYPFRCTFVKSLWNRIRNSACCTSVTCCLQVSNGLMQGLIRPTPSGH